MKQSFKRKVHFLPVAYSSSPKSCIIYPIDFSISSILLPEINKLHTHLINPTDDISRHFIESVLHLFQHVLDEGIELFCWGIFWDSWIVIHFLSDWVIWIFYKNNLTYIFFMLFYVMRLYFIYWWFIRFVSLLNNVNNPNTKLLKI